MAEKTFEIGRLLLRAARTFSSQVCDELDKRAHPNVKSGHALLIANLDAGGTRVSVLAERAEVSKQAMGQMVREMEALGYLTRQSDPTDGRATLVMPTESGRKLLEDVAQTAQIIEARQVEKIGEADLNHLRHTLSKWLDSLA